MIGRRVTTDLGDGVVVSYWSSIIGNMYVTVKMDSGLGMVYFYADDPKLRLLD
jgi:hypothetical protein